MATSATIKRRLYTLVWIWNFVPAVGFFKLLGSSKLHVGRYFETFGDVINPIPVSAFLLEQWPALLLCFLFVILYTATTFEQRRSVTIAESLFSPEETPSDWAKFTGRDALVIVLGVNIVQFLALAWSVDNIVFFSGVLCAFFMVSIFANYKAKQTILTYLRDPIYKPSLSYRYSPFIERRREAVRQFLSHHHVAKEIALFVGCGVVFLLAWLEPLDMSSVHFWIPYLVLTVIIVTNEATMLRWRLARNRAIDKIDDEQIADTMRQEEERRTVAGRNRGERLIKQLIPPSRKIGGLPLAAIFDLPPLTVALLVLLLDFGIVTLFMYCEGTPPWERHHYRSFLYNDTVFIPLYCSMVVVILRDAPVLTGIFTLPWWHILLFVGCCAASLLLEARAVWSGQYSIAQELSPSKLWHTLIFGCVGYWLIAPLIPILIVRSPKWAVGIVLIAVSGIFYNIYRDAVLPFPKDAHLEGSYFPWKWTRRLPELKR